MGFPTWTLIGMGVCGFGALLAVTFSYLAQSPLSLKRIGLGGYRLDLRVREFTGYALALLLLSFGFFLAGVPLGGENATAVSNTPMTVTPEQVSNLVIETAVSSTLDLSGDGTSVSSTPTSSSSSSGAFGGPPPGDSETASETETAVPDDLAESDPEIEVATGTKTPVPNNTSSPTPAPLSTSTPTAIPTATSLPTLTPTPIDGETAVVNTGGSTLWVRRSPGGQTLTLLRDGDIVILSARHGNQGGIIWREIRTVNNILGWIQEEFLLLDAAENGQ